MADRVLTTLYPEHAAFGFSRVQHRFVYFSYLNSILRPDMTVVDLGAGRDKWEVIETGYLRSLTRLKGKVARLIGADVDTAVLDNPVVDEAVILKIGAPYPFDAGSIDLITSWATLEHIANAEETAREIERILKPGGWFCAWTPNKWGYVGMGARLIPNALHKKLLRFFAPKRDEVDTFPTTYRMNTIKDLKRLFPETRFEHFSYVHNGPPSYYSNKLWLARFWQFYGWATPAGMGQGLHVFIRKR